MEFNRLDVSTKELVWDDPAAWLERYAIEPRGPVEVIDSDITTLTASADKVLRVGGSEPYLVDLEPHSYHDTSLTRTLWFRQVALDYRHDLPVLTVLILLCKQQFPARDFRPENTLVLISHFANSLRIMLSRIPYLTAWVDGVARNGSCSR